MTEEEWLGATSPHLLLRWLRSPDDARCMRFYACACCRLVADLLVDPRSVHALETVELFSIGEADIDDFSAAFVAAEAARRAVCETWHAAPPLTSSNFAALGSTQAALAVCIAMKVYESSVYVKVKEALRAAFAGRGGDTTQGFLLDRLELTCPILRDIYGNPFRVGRFDPAWRTPAAVGLARSMFLALDFSNMPVLADALDDAGCDDDEMLAHCRGPGPHYRGCWVVDVVMGRA